MACKDTGKLDFKNPNSVLNALLNLFKITKSNVSSTIPAPLLLGASCGKLSPSEVAANIIRRQAEAGIPVGPLPSGEISPDEIMERIRTEEILTAISTKMVLQVAIEPGTALSATGVSPTGPVTVAGATTAIAKGKAMVCK